MPAGSTYTPIATTTLGSNQASVSFSSLGSYTDIYLVYSAKGTAATDVRLQFNGDTGTNYSNTALSGSGSAASSSRQSNNTKIYLDSYGYIDTTNFNNAEYNFMSYGNTNFYKIVLGRSNNAATGTDAICGTWRSTAAVTSINLAPDTGSFVTGSTFTIYGIASA